jgi:hypothetical protein
MLSSSRSSATNSRRRSISSSSRKETIPGVCWLLALRERGDAARAILAAARAHLRDLAESERWAPVATLRGAADPLGHAALAADLEQAVHEGSSARAVSTSSASTEPH